MEHLSPEHADSGYARIVKRLLDMAATIPAGQGIEQWPEAFNIKSVERNIENGGVYVFYNEQGNPIGTVDLRDNDEAVWGEDGISAVYAHRLAIDPAYSGRGVGQQIINWVVNKAQSEERDFIRLDCVSHNQKLRTYYESKGFVHVRDIEYGGNGASLYEMSVKDLTR
jgi:GNAT superfamily N-acetyltransferase